MPDLPKLLFTDVVVEASEVPREKWDEYLAGYTYADIDRQTKIAEMMFTENIKVLSAVEHSVPQLRQWTGLQKVPAIVELLKSELDAKAYDKVVVFGVHRAVLQELRDALRDYGAVLIYGGTPPAKRDLLIKKFQTDPACRVFVGNIQAAGTAINLTAAHHVVFAEADWTPANNSQAAMRVHRIGQDKPVTVRFIGMADSIDEKISRVLKNKTRSLTELFDAGKTFY